MSFRQIAAELGELQDAYEQVEGTAVPNTLKDAIADRWELTTAGIQIAGLTLYPRHIQDQDQRRCIPLRKALVLLRELEEETIREVVTKPEVIFARMLFSLTLGWRRHVLTIGYDLYRAIEAALDTPTQLLRTLAAHLLTLLTARFLRTLDLIAVPEMAKAFAAGMKLRDKKTGAVRSAALPQSRGKRWKVRKTSRR